MQTMDFLFFTQISKYFKVLIICVKTIVPTNLELRLY